MDTKKFNPENPSKFTPLAYVEETTRINKEVDGFDQEKFNVISIGAFEEYSHRAPEYGGVAIVHKHPDVIIGIKYIPWDVEGRAIEHAAVVERIENGNMSSQVLYEFLSSVGYDILAEGEADRNEYMEEKLRNQLNPQAEESDDEESEADTKILEAIDPEKEETHYNGEEIISLD